MADFPTSRRLVPALALGGALALMLAGCGGQKEAAAGNDVQLRDMEVTDGTANDSMTDLDAVKADGMGVAGNATNATAAVQRAEKDADEDEKNAESVAAE